jgi:hypothetical protein
MRKLILALFLLASTLSFGQAALPVGATIGMNSLGYINPSFTVYIAPQYEARHFLVVSTNSFSPTGKGYGVGGYQYGTQDFGYVRFHGLLAGGGFYASRLNTPQYEKGSVRPAVSGGFETQGVRLTVDYIFPGTDARNGLHGIRFASEIPLTASKRLKLVLNGAAYDFYQTDNPSNRDTGGQISTGLQWNLLKTKPN